MPRWRGSIPMVQCRASQQLQQLDRRRQLRRRGATCTYPEPETEKERSSVDFPQVRAVACYCATAQYLQRTHAGAPDKLTGGDGSSSQ